MGIMELSKEGGMVTEYFDCFSIWSIGALHCQTQIANRLLYISKSTKKKKKDIICAQITSEISMIEGGMLARVMSVKLLSDVCNYRDKKTVKTRNDALFSSNSRQTGAKLDSKYSKR
jgi:hypothetical protein